MALISLRPVAGVLFFLLTALRATLVDVWIIDRALDGLLNILKLLEFVVLLSDLRIVDYTFVLHIAKLIDQEQITFHVDGTLAC